MKRKILKVMFLVLVLQMMGCGAVMSMLPTVVAAVIDAVMILDTIEEFTDKYFIAHPDPSKEAAVSEALQKARTSLDVALRVAQSTEELTKGDVIKAFEGFRDAYEKLLVLVGPLGVNRAKPGKITTFAVSASEITVPNDIQS